MVNIHVGHNIIAYREKEEFLTQTRYTLYNQCRRTGRILRFFERYEYNNKGIRPLVDSYLFNKGIRPLVDSYLFIQFTYHPNKRAYKDIIYKSCGGRVINSIQIQYDIKQECIYYEDYRGNCWDKNWGIENIYNYEHVIPECMDIIVEFQKKVNEKIDENNRERLRMTSILELIKNK